MDRSVLLLSIYVYPYFFNTIMRARSYSAYSADTVALCTLTGFVSLVAGLLMIYLLGYSAFSWLAIVLIASEITVSIGYLLLSDQVSFADARS